VMSWLCWRVWDVNLRGMEVTWDSHVCLYIMGTMDAWVAAGYWLFSCIDCGKLFNKS